ncbi:MAG: lactate 2-monooxygenase [Saprospiraceae bacterium]|nr:lactate 2-monooxygenase [Saprospiraceae bacterium]
MINAVSPVINNQRMSKQETKVSPFSAVERQKTIYTAGMSGQKPKIPIDLTQLETVAKDRISKEAFAYISGGAGKELTIGSNRNDFSKWQILPRMLRDVSEHDTSIELFGRKLPSPIMLSPVGVLEMAHKKADLAVAKAAAKLHIPYILSNQASTPMEEVGKVMGDAPRWFQLYWSKSYELVESLVQRAEASGCEAITVTLDTTMLGWRMQDLDLAYLPFLRGKGIAQYTSDPVFQSLVDKADHQARPDNRITLDTILALIDLMKTYPGNFFKNLRSGRPLKAVRTFINLYTKPSLHWSDLKFLRERTKLPIVLKGILHPEDAQIAIDHGIDGIIVSNHGGRQVDGSISTIQALPAIKKTVKDQIPLIIDSGIRTGADVMKALALGAKAVCIGRPYVYGLALDGQRGVESVIYNLMSDFELNMRLSGYKSIEELQPDILKFVP